MVAAVVIESVFRAMADYKHHHATIFVTPSIAGRIEALRREWDPRMAGQIAAHVTLAYPQEAPRLDLLVARVRLSSNRIAPFRLRLGGVTYDGRPEDGIYIVVEDVDGGYRDLRAEILCPPFKPLDFLPHVTLVHPQTSSLGRECWEQLRDRDLDLMFTANEVGITAFDGRQWRILNTFVLRQNG